VFFSQRKHHPGTGRAKLDPDRVAIRRTDVVSRFLRGAVVAAVLALPLVALRAGTGDGADGKAITRYGVAPDLATYPQGTPKEALGSVLKAIENKRFDYLVAQLADPQFVDDRIQRLEGGRFEQRVEDTRARLDPAAVKQLRRFLQEGEWGSGDTEVAVRLKEVTSRLVYLRKVDGRWYLEHRSAPEKAN
jgi:hypothetical protein